MGKIVLELDVMMAKRHISLGDLAEQVGITNVNLSKIRFTTLANICQALECEPGDILKYDPDAGE